MIQPSETPPAGATGATPAAAPGPDVPVDDVPVDDVPVDDVPAAPGPGGPAAAAAAVATVRLHDTAAGAVRPLALRDVGRVSMYVCGPTVYDLPHLGHGRFTLVFDVLRRYLRFRGLDVRYVSNVTDVDDKILDRARAEGASPLDVARRYEAAWWDAMDALGVLRPDEAPRATDWVPAMIGLIADLVDRDLAYDTDDGVYLDVDQVPGYGLLALQPLESLRAGARVERNEDKRSPLDFALWKKVPPTSVPRAAGDGGTGTAGVGTAGTGEVAAEGEGDLWWPSPWGPGRPGWHTECVVMSLGLLGDGFDLHGGGQDLRFPHHENERAQAVALGRPFARHWAHNGFVEVEGEKMSKSLGNFTSLSDLLGRADPRAYRLLVLRSHYRKPIEVNETTVADAEEGLARLDALARRLPGAVTGGAAATAGVVPGVDGADLVVAAGADPAAVAAFAAALDDDLDSPAALAGLFELVRRANAAADAGDGPGASVAATTVGALTAALGLPLQAEADELDPATAALVAARDGARSARDWARADAVRDELAAAGWVVEDGPTGTRVRRG